MKTSLPTVKTSKGFTLIELLIVVTILGILALIGVAAFRGLQGRGNDEKRNADLNAIASALEVNRVAGKYVGLADSQFASGKIPTDPISTRHYCISHNTAGTAISKPAAWAAGCTAPFVQVASGVPDANTTIWMVCATLQDDSTVGCRNSAQ